MSFGSMVWFMVKWSIAAIPAVVILALIGAVATTFLLSVVRGMFAG